MKLTYKILWIDDNIEDYIDMGIKSEFMAFLDNLGFIPTIDTFEEVKEAEKAISSVKYDLILSDYNIDERLPDQQGDILIRKIRDEGIFTEVLFYSAQNNFEEIARRLYQDRVSFFSLVGDEGMKEFRARTYKLIQLTVSKLQELNSIRGLVMSETSELDNSVIDILATFFSSGAKESDQLKDYIVEIIVDSASGNSRKAARLQEMPPVEILRQRIFDADKKARTIGKLIELRELTAEGPFSNFYENYKRDVLNTRNDLAHAKSDIIDGIECLIVSRGVGHHPEKFDQEKCVRIRKNLRKHAEVLKAIREITMPSGAIEL